MALINYFSVVGKSLANDDPLATGGASAKAVLAKVVSVTNANKRSANAPFFMTQAFLS